MPQQILRHLDGIDDCAVRTHERHTRGSGVPVTWLSSSVRSGAVLYARRSCTGRWLRPSSTYRMARLAARHTILDVIGCLLTNRCQVEKLLFYGSVFSRFGKSPIFGRFVPQIIGPIHVAPSFPIRRRRRPFKDRLSAFDCHRKPRSPDYLHAAVRQEIIPPEGAHPHKDPIALSLVRCWREAMPVGGPGTERYLTRFLVRPENTG